MKTLSDLMYSRCDNVNLDSRYRHNVASPVFLALVGVYLTLSRLTLV